MEEFNKEIDNLLEVFKMNIRKSSIISQLRKEHIEPVFLGELAIELKSIQESQGVENIARSQSVVVLVTSFEAFAKDLFRLMINRDDLLKKALRQCQDIKLKSGDLLEILNNRTSWGELMIDKNNLSFQNLHSICSALKMLGVEFEDILETTLVDLNNVITKESKGKITMAIRGKELFSQLLEMRHMIVHESKVYAVNEIDLNNYLIFLQLLVHQLCNEFRSTRLPEAKFLFQKIDFA